MLMRSHEREHSQEADRDAKSTFQMSSAEGTLSPLGTALLPVQVVMKAASVEAAPVSAGR